MTGNVASSSAVTLLDVERRNAKQEVLRWVTSQLPHDKECYYFVLSFKHQVTFVDASQAVRMLLRKLQTQLVGRRKPIPLFSLSTIEGDGNTTRYHVNLYLSAPPLSTKIRSEEHFCWLVIKLWKDLRVGGDKNTVEKIYDLKGALNYGFKELESRTSKKVKRQNLGILDVMNLHQCKTPLHQCKTATIGK